jgi:transcriptional regulator with XRE-family HTH domain
MVKLKTLKQLRELKPWTQEDLRKATGITIASISRIENRTQKPTPKTKIKIANAFGIESSLIDW